MRKAVHVFRRFPLLFGVFVLASFGGSCIPFPEPTDETYPPQTAVDTLGMKKLPLSECPVENYSTVFAFDAESHMTRGKRWIRQMRAKKLDYDPYESIKTSYLGKPYFVDAPRKELKIAPLNDRKNAVATVTLPRVVYLPAAFQHRMKGKEYLVIYVEHVLMSNSSTLLVFDEKFQIVYQDHLPGAREIGAAGEKIVVKTEEFWYRGDIRVDVNDCWVYFVP